MLDSELDIELVHGDQAVVVVAHGQIDYRSGPRFLAALLRAVLGGRRQVIVDLTAVDYIGLEATSALEAAARAATDQGVSLQTAPTGGRGGPPALPE